jgi:hypothetical protein
VPFEPRRVPAGTIVYRGLGSGSQLDRNREPWGIKYPAFIRKRKDDDGLTVVPEPHLCCEIRLLQIAKIDVAEIEKLVNPVTGEHLYVWQDTADHACIPNLPYHDEHPQGAQDLATDLAGISEVLTEEEFEEAKEMWATRDEASEDHQPE